jgi:hypothetical protein
LNDQAACCTPDCCDEPSGEDAAAHQPVEEKLRDENSSLGRSVHVLSLLREQLNGEVTFQGLKRKLGWHQEIVSRTLKRLELDGLILRTQSGAYKLSSSSLHLSASKGDAIREDVTPVTQLWLPKDLDTDALASTLKNTWFGGWRWYGYRTEDSEQLLTWISESGDLWINIRISNVVAFVEAGPVGSAGRERCLYAGYDLLGHVVNRYKPLSAGAEQTLLQPN